MSDERWERIKALFQAALEQPSDEREAFVQRASEGDEELAAEVLAMLAADASAEEPGGFLELTEEIQRASPGTAAANMPPGVPRRLGEFELLEEIGAGAMGVVFRARQQSLGRIVAVKVMQPHLAFSSQQIQRFHLEATAAARVQHPAIVPVHSVGEEAGVHYFAMDLIEGESLQAFLAQQRSRSGAPSGPPSSATSGGRALSHVTWVAGFVAEAAEALAVSHEQQIIHRDIKPGNILMDREGRPHLVDFGLAKDLQLESMLHTGRVIGTPYYMSPEQARVRGVQVDHRTDIYSLGVVLYEMLGLRRPFEGDTHQEVFREIREVNPVPVRRLNPRVPKDLATICHKAMEKNPVHRYANARDLASDLRRFLNHESIHARPPSAAELARRLVARRWGWFLGAAAVLVALVAGSWIATDLSRRARLERTLEPLRAAQGRSFADLSTEALLDLGAAAARAREGDWILSTEEDRLVAGIEASLEDEALRVAGRVRGDLEGVLDLDGGGLTAEATLAAMLEILSPARALALAPQHPEVRRVLDPREWYPRLTVTSEPSGAQVYLVGLSHHGPEWAEPQLLGTTPLREMPVAPTFGRIFAVLEGLGHAEATRMLATGTVELHLPIRAAAEVEDGMIPFEAGPAVVGTGREGLMPFPRRTVSLRSFHLDRTEVSVGEYRRFLTQSGYPPPGWWPPDSEIEAWLDRPVTRISLRDAEAYCLWAGKRLPTIWEWERGARGTDGRSVPWTEGTPTAEEVAARAVLNRPLPEDDPGTVAEERRLVLAALAPVDSLPAGASPDGLLHTLGNVREWTESRFLDPTPEGRWVPSAADVVVKGGSFDHRPGIRLDSSFDRSADFPTWDIGFRCARSVWP